MGEDALAGFHERRKQIDPTTPDRIAVRWGPNHNKLGLLEKAYKGLGEPEYVKFYWKGQQLAIVPTGERDPNGYSVSNHCVSAGWFKSKLEQIPKPGWYEAEIDDGVLFVDLGDEPFRTA